MKIFFWFLVVCLVIFRYFSVRPNYKEGQKLKITGTLHEEPVRYSNYQKFNFANLEISLPLYPEINYGDKIVVSGVVNKDKLDNATLVESELSRGLIPTLRKNLISFYQKKLPEPHSSLVAGITLGSKSSLPEDFWSALKKSGTAHVVVASGMNVTMVSGFLISFLASILSRKKAIPLALLGIGTYTAISGFDAPIIRAAIMGTVAFTAQELGRVAYGFRTLVITGIGMLLFRPAWIGDTGFILSFVATASLMLFGKRIGKWIKTKLKFLPGFFKADLGTTLAAQIGVAPILFVTFGQFNPLSPLINAAVLWTVPPIMIIGVVGGGVGLILPEAGRLILYLTYPLTWWFVSVVSL